MHAPRRSGKIALTNSNAFYILLAISVCNILFFYLFSNASKSDFHPKRNYVWKWLRTKSNTKARKVAREKMLLAIESDNWNPYSSNLLQRALGCTINKCISVFAVVALGFSCVFMLTSTFPPHQPIAMVRLKSLFCWMHSWKKQNITEKLVRKSSTVVSLQTAQHTFKCTLALTLNKAANS